MPLASFEQLCAGLCELVQVQAPPLATDEQGLVAFHVVMRGVTVNFVHRPDISPEHVFVIFELGTLVGASEQAFARLQALMDANFVLLEVNPPVFSRSPDTGEVVLQYVYSLFESDATALYRLVDDGIDRIERWTRDAPLSCERGSSSSSHSDRAILLHQFA